MMPKVKAIKSNVSSIVRCMIPIFVMFFCDCVKNYFFLYLLLCWICANLDINLDLYAGVIKKSQDHPYLYGVGSLGEQAAHQIAFTRV